MFSKKTVLVHNGLDALEYMLSVSYDAVVLDIMMPGLDGLEVLKRAREKGVGTPVLFLTAKAEVEDRIAGLDAGWLRRILQAQGIERDRDVLIATLDTQGSLLVQEKGSEGRLMTLPVMKSGQVRW